MSRRHCIICDGCGKEVEWADSKSRAQGRPYDWRALVVTDSDGGQRRFDVCSPRCASKAVDRTYERQDRQLAEKHGLEVVR